MPSGRFDSRQLLFVVVFFGCSLSSPIIAKGQSDAKTTTEPAAQASETGPVKKTSLVDFSRDIAPVLHQRCGSCHSAGEAKGGVSVQDRDSLLGYIEKNSIESSSLWTDYLTADPDAPKSTVMPPKNKGGPLSTSELTLIKTWIEEGANWPEGATVGEQRVPVQADPKSLVQRVWIFQGFFHPATVHFPIALISVGALSVFLSWFLGKRAEDFAWFCLLLGSLSSVAAATMGWSFADSQGLNDSNSTLFWHRWLGVTLAGASVLIAIIAFFARSRKSPQLSRVWKIGLLMLGALVGWVGHQGGELKYGEELYHDAFKILTGEK